MKLGLNSLSTPLLRYGSLANESRTQPRDPRGALRRHLWRHDRLCPVKTEINTCEPRPNQPMSTTVEINDVPLDLKTAPTPTPLERTATSLQNLRSGLVQSESSKKLKAALTIKRKKKAGFRFDECCWFIYLVIMTAGVLAPGPIFLSIYNGNDGPNAPCSTGATQWLHEIAVMATVFTLFLVLTILGGFWGGRIKSWLWNRVPEDKRDCAKTTGAAPHVPRAAPHAGGHGLPALLVHSGYRFDQAA